MTIPSRARQQAATLRAAMASKLALGAIVLSSCNPAVDPDIVYEEGFETLCDEAPCGWVQSRGPDGAATWVETLPGDHGLRLDGDDVFVRGPAAPMLERIVGANTVALRASARCDDLASITVRATIEDASRVVTLEGELVPSSSWEPMLRDVSMSPVDGEPPPYNVQRVLGVSMLKHGDGSCEIDYIAIRGLNLAI